MKFSSTYIITMDGTSGSGKTTISRILADKLNFCLLDSGKLYRSAGYLLSQSDFSVNNIPKIMELISSINLKLNNHSEYEVYADDTKIDHLLYTEEVGKSASKVSKIPEVRHKMLHIQHSCIQGKGLIANGRDMGTEVYPNAQLKLFISASLEIRAQRRHKELCDKGESVSLENILELLEKRDESDKNRAISPLKVPHNAVILDSSYLKPDAIVDKILNLYTISKN